MGKANFPRELNQLVRSIEKLVKSKGREASKTRKRFDQARTNKEIGDNPCQGAPIEGGQSVPPEKLKDGFDGLSARSGEEEKLCLEKLAKHAQVFMAARVLCIAINCFKGLMYSGKKPIVVDDLQLLIATIDEEEQQLNQKYLHEGEIDEAKRADGTDDAIIVDELGSTRFFELGRGVQDTMLYSYLLRYWEELALQLQNFSTTEVLMPTQARLEVISRKEQQYEKIRNDYRWALALFLFAFLGVGVGGTAAAITFSVKVSADLGLIALGTILVGGIASILFNGSNARRSYNDEGTALKTSLDSKKKTLNDEYSPIQRSLPEQVQSVKNAGRTFFTADSLTRIGVFASPSTKARTDSHTDSNRTFEGRTSAPPEPVCGV